jgi:hypothetical protein
MGAVVDLSVGRHPPETSVRRNLGFVVFLGLLLLGTLLRCHTAIRADTLLANEARTRETLATLFGVSQAITRSGTRHPGLRGEVLAAVPELQPLPELSSEQISYAQDDLYIYGAATRTVTEAQTSSTRQGFVLRAWPLSFGSTGDFEFQLSDDGALWQGQNLLGRSGTSVAFPPRFPEPTLGNPDEAWWIVPLPGHR